MIIFKELRMKVAKQDLSEPNRTKQKSGSATYQLFKLRQVT